MTFFDTERGDGVLAEPNRCDAYDIMNEARLKASRKA
jgi:hypothetical protein